MAQVDIKDRIKEMRLRVLAEPLGQAAMQEADKSLVVGETIQTSNETVSEEKKFDNNSVRKKSAEKKNVAKKNVGKRIGKQLNEKTNEKGEGKYLIEELIKSDTSNSFSPKNEIQSEEENSKENSKENTHIEQSFLEEYTQTENEHDTDGIVNLTDKWVELEVRSRLSGLEQHEKQTRAMLKEIVDVLDRIENLEYVKPNEETTSLSVTKSNKKVPTIKKLNWSEVIKRTFVVIGTFLVLTGIIWGVLYYLFF